ncbi:MAG: PLD nuclease N-terminal domain-containing protein [Jatrophihabitans sp.]
MLIRLGGLFFLISLIFWLWALFDSITTDRERVRSLPKWAWIVVILLFLEVGALAWVLLGRPRAGQRTARTRFGGATGLGGARGSAGSAGTTGSAADRWAAGRGGAGRRPVNRPVGPDDDPDFLRGLSGPKS